MRDYKLEGILGPLFKMLETSFELFVPLVVVHMVDVGIQGRDSGYTLKMGGVPVLLVLIGLVCSLTAQYFVVEAATGAATSLHNDLFSYIGRSSYTEIDTVGMAALITRVTDGINQVQSGTNMTLRLLLRLSFVVSGAMTMTFIADVYSVFVFIVTTLALYVVTFGIVAVNMPFYKSVQKQLDKVLLTTREDPLGVRVIRAFNRQESETEKSGRENRSLVRMQVFVGKISALLNPVTHVIINMAIVAVIWVEAEQVDSVVLTQGKMIVLVNYMSQILVGLIKTASLTITVSKAVACMNRADGVFQMESSIEDRGTSRIREHKSRAPKIEFKDMKLVYAGAKESALQGVSFRIMAGQTIGVIGGTGLGKSILVNLVPRLYNVASGQVLVDGADVKGYPLDGLRGKMEVVPQKSALFKGTLRDNMCQGRQDASDEDTYKTLDTAQARGFMDSKGEDLGLYVNRGDHNLSGGQRQRLTIARALMRKPEILITDDSAPALDYATDTRLRKAIRENTGDMIISIASQRAVTIKGVDTILMLDEGRLASMGAHKELFKDYQAYRGIYLSQLSEEEVERDEQ